MCQRDRQYPYCLLFATGMPCPPRLPACGAPSSSPLPLWSLSAMHHALWQVPGVPSLTCLTYDFILLTLYALALPAPSDSTGHHPCTETTFLSF